MCVGGGDMLWLPPPGSCPECAPPLAASLGRLRNPLETVWNLVKLLQS